MVKDGAGVVHRSYPNQKSLRPSRIQPLAESVQEVGDGCLQVAQANPELAVQVGFIEDHLKVRNRTSKKPMKPPPFINAKGQK